MAVAWNGFPANFGFRSVAAGGSELPIEYVNMTAAFSISFPSLNTRGLDIPPPGVAMFSDENFSLVSSDSRDKHICSWRV